MKIALMLAGLLLLLMAWPAKAQADRHCAWNMRLIPPVWECWGERRDWNRGWGDERRQEYLWRRENRERERERDHYCRWHPC